MLRIDTIEKGKSAPGTNEDHVEDDDNNDNDDDDDNYDNKKDNDGHDIRDFNINASRRGTTR